MLEAIATSYFSTLETVLKFGYITEDINFASTLGVASEISSTVIGLLDIQVWRRRPDFNFFLSTFQTKKNFWSVLRKVRSSKSDLDNQRVLRVGVKFGREVSSYLDRSDYQDTIHQVCEATPSFGNDFHFDIDSCHRGILDCFKESLKRVVDNIGRGFPLLYVNLTPEEYDALFDRENLKRELHEVLQWGTEVRLNSSSESSQTSDSSSPPSVGSDICEQQSQGSESSTSVPQEDSE